MNINTNEKDNLREKTARQQQQQQQQKKQKTTTQNCESREKNAQYKKTETNIQKKKKFLKLQQNLCMGSEKETKEFIHLNATMYKEIKL